MHMIRVLAYGVFAALFGWASGTLGAAATLPTTPENYAKSLAALGALFFVAAIATAIVAAVEIRGELMRAAERMREVRTND